MINRKALLTDLQKQVKGLETDLREQVETAEETVTVGGATSRRKIRERLDAEYRRAFALGRTAATWAAWRDERVTQSAVAWVLGTVFVRFCEDNGLLASPYLASPEHERMVLAEEAQEEFFAENPAETDRGWLLAAFAEIAESQAGALLFDRRHNALYQVPVSHDAAKALIAFWRRRGEDGRLIHDFVSDDWDTRFLGDLYQDLSESARKNYALLQTPDFVEEFILDYTLNPAIAEFGHDVVKVIDPTCGSGHFVLGAFHRLLAEWVRQAPTRDRRELVRLALQAVHGVDVNPFAIAIARFRLFIAALQAAGFATLNEAKRYEFPLKLAIGDSLIKARQLELISRAEVQLQTAKGTALSETGLPGVDKQGPLFSTGPEQTDLFDADDIEGSEVAEVAAPADELAEFAYATEDLADFPGILQPSSYHVVVGNPPYINIEDRKLKKLYQELYDACTGNYSLSVPFAQRFFELAVRIGPDGRGAGYVGQITANSFMKREFGESLAKNFLAISIDLTHVIDTSGAHIPDHGTPTVILIGRRQAGSVRSVVRTVRSIQGEPVTPEDPRRGLVWQAISEQIESPGSPNKWISVGDLDKKRYFARFPWILQDGGLELVEELEKVSAAKLNKKVVRIGFFGDTHADEVFSLPYRLLNEAPAEEWLAKPTSRGDDVRDWSIIGSELVATPYTSSRHVLELQALPSRFIRRFWPWRTTLWARTIGSGSTYRRAGKSWWAWHQFPRDFGTHSWQIAFGFVVTGNHFFLDRVGQVFNRSAPVIKFPEGMIEDRIVEISGVLNSSTSCFWLKQVSHDKGNRGGERGTGRYAWESFYEFTGTKLQEFPLPKTFPLQLSKELDALVQRLSNVSPAKVCAEASPNRKRLAAARQEWESIRGRMIALQEELDWQVYSFYGLLDDEQKIPSESVPSLNLGERAFEILMARNPYMNKSDEQWFVRHRREGSRKVTELPEHWPEEYKAVVERRIALIESDRNIGLLERPEYKRRWALLKDNKPWTWPEQEAAALRGWLLDRLEARELWFHEVDGMEQPRVLTTSQLADLVRRDADVVSVAELYAPGKELETVVAELAADEHVPYLAQLRYKDSGLTKRAGWEDVWDRQRKEDAAQAIADEAKAAADEAYEQAKVIEDEAERQRAMEAWADLDRAWQRAEQRVKEIRDAIPVPDKYTSGDFLKPSYWRNRGKLDVPKERFISYPHAGREGDPALLLGWAGWNHREQAQALAALIVDREQSHGWTAERLTPLLAGLREVLPWVRQWHDEFDPVYGASPAEIYEGFFTQTRDRLHLTDEDLTKWRPRSTGRGKKKS